MDALGPVGAASTQGIATRPPQTSTPAPTTGSTAAAGGPQDAAQLSPEANVKLAGGQFKSALGGLTDDQKKMFNQQMDRLMPALDDEDKKRAAQGQPPLERGSIIASFAQQWSYNGLNGQSPNGVNVYQGQQNPNDKGLANLFDSSTNYINAMATLAKSHQQQ